MARRVIEMLSVDALLHGFPQPNSDGRIGRGFMHLVCLNRRSGEVLWDQTVEPVLPEGPHSGNFTEHG